MPHPDANLAVGGAEHHGTLMLATWNVVYGPLQRVHLMENTILVEVPDDMWVLDIGANNHMKGVRSMLT